MNIIEQMEAEQVERISAKRAVPEFSAGDTLRVLVRVAEGTRERIQAYEGVCIGRGGTGLNESFTVRKISYGEGVERVFPIYSTLIDGIEVIRRGKVRRASFIIFVDAAVNQLASLKQQMCAPAALTMPTRRPLQMQKLQLRLKRPPSRLLPLRKLLPSRHSRFST